MNDEIMANRIRPRPFHHVKTRVIIGSVAFLCAVFCVQKLQESVLFTHSIFRMAQDLEFIQQWRLRNRQLTDEEPVASESMALSSSGDDNQNSVVHPRAFRPWPSDRPLPCFPPDGIMVEGGPVLVKHNHPVSKGFFFLKTYKTASSTSAGVNLRIARNVAKRQDRDFDFCKCRFDHGRPWHVHGAKLFGDRRRDKSFLWAILRDPTKRAISWFFHFWVSRKGMEATDEKFIEGMRYLKKNYYVRSLAPEPFVDDEHDGIEVANEIIRSFDFIGVTERLNESFVALAMLLRIPLSDVLYLSVKMNGEYDEHCVFIQPSVLTPGMKKYLESDEWKEIIREDLALHQAANRSLDMTIDRLGREQFEHNLAKYQYALAEGFKRCAETTVFPCTKDGELVPPSETDCLWTDSGCGYECLDQVAIDLKLDDEFFGRKTTPGKLFGRIGSNSTNIS